MWVLKRQEQEIGIKSQDTPILAPINAEVEIHIERHIGGFQKTKSLFAEVIYASKYNKPVVFAQTLDANYEMYLCFIGIYKNAGRQNNIINILKLYVNL